MSFRNESARDRVVRIALGAVMLWAGWSGAVEGVWAIALQIFAWVPLVTGILGWCPIYAILGLSTCKQKLARRDP